MTGAYPAPCIADSARPSVGTPSYIQLRMSLEMHFPSQLELNVMGLVKPKAVFMQSSGLGGKLCLR